VSIARRVGISAPSLYWHYKSKEDILFAFLERQWIDFSARMKEASGQGTATQRLRNLATSHVRYETDRLIEARAFSQQFSKSQLHRTLPPERRKILQGYLDRYLMMCCSIIEEGVADGRFMVSNQRAVGFAIINMCETVAGWFDPSNVLTAEAMASLYGDLALRLVGVIADQSPGEDDVRVQPSR
jgi:AcrR family transcriptional regulator